MLVDKLADRGKTACEDAVVDGSEVGGAFLELAVQMARRSSVESGSSMSGTRKVASMRSKGRMGLTPCVM